MAILAVAKKMEIVITGLVSTAETPETLKETLASNSNLLQEALRGIMVITSVTVQEKGGENK